MRPGGTACSAVPFLLRTERMGLPNGRCALQGAKEYSSKSRSVVARKKPSMKVALIGLPQSGKSSVFAAATGQVPEQHGPREIHRAMARVPDERVDRLGEICRPKKLVYESIEFLDVPGCSLDNPAGLEEWRKFLPTIRQADALVVVARDFENPAVPAAKGRVDAAVETATVWDELIFSDLEAVTTRIERLEKSLKKPTKTHEQEKRELGILQKCAAALEAGDPLSAVLTSEEDQKAVASFAFLTQLPLVVVRNVSEGAPVEPLAVPHATESLAFCASIEAEIATLDAEDRRAFLAEMGIDEPAQGRLVQACYLACGLISFLTMGPDECRAWSVAAGSTAQQAAGKIHSDLAHGFIRAETVSFDDLIACGDLKGAKGAGKVRKEGKTYVVQDGDILNILSSA